MPRRGGRASGSEGYSITDIDKVVDCVRSVKPIGANEWEEVLEQYQQYAAANGRAVRNLISIKKKFQSLINAKEPTGDPDCPEYVRDAREVQDLNAEKTEHDDDIDDSRGGTQESANDRSDDPAQPDESTQQSDGAPHYDGGGRVGQPNNHRQSDQASYFSECMS
ncbi:hypothetical protein F441_05782 [Phytophthora nicotianae CJ01A1]|uniref:DUF6818 domain-containing protein n=1 Tax=Phytophthora nicotianae CJ01A1 TaxID=1317063 RepID=W2XEW2_PHYNI|nr:hypothetical protein F441_05782 [Phytophthora nicotianae CJ01A1]